MVRHIDIVGAKHVPSGNNWLLSKYMILWHKYHMTSETKLYEIILWTYQSGRIKMKQARW